MRRAAMWLNLYGREAVRHKLKNGLKQAKIAFFCVFRPFLSSCRTASRNTVYVQAAAYNGARTVFCAGPNVHVVHNSTNRDSSPQELYTITVVE